MNIKTEIWNGHKMRFVERALGDWWGVAEDVTQALNIKNTSQAVNGNAKSKSKGLPERDKGVCSLYTPGGLQEKLIVSENGIYKLIFRSHKAEAEEFQDWVCNVIKELRQASGLEGFQVFRMLDKEHQCEAMDKLNAGLQQPTKKTYIKANTVTDKAISTVFGYSKMIKKDDMTPDMLLARQQVLDDTVNLMMVNERFGLGL